MEQIKEGCAFLLLLAASHTHKINLYECLLVQEPQDTHNLSLLPNLNVLESAKKITKN